MLDKAVDSRATRAYRALPLAQAGHRERALEIARELEQEPRHDYAGFVLSALYGFLGEEDQALRILEKLFEERPRIAYFFEPQEA